MDELGELLFQETIQIWKSIGGLKHKNSRISRTWTLNMDDGQSRMWTLQHWQSSLSKLGFTRKTRLDSSRKWTSVEKLGLASIKITLWQWLLHSYGPVEIVDFPMQNGDWNHGYVNKLPEGLSSLFPWVFLRFTYDFPIFLLVFVWFPHFPTMITLKIHRFLGQPTDLS